MKFLKKNKRKPVKEILAVMLIFLILIGSYGAYVNKDLHAFLNLDDSSDYQVDYQTDEEEKGNGIFNLNILDYFNSQDTTVENISNNENTNNININSGGMVEYNNPYASFQQNWQDYHSMQNFYTEQLEQQEDEIMVLMEELYFLEETATTISGVEEETLRNSAPEEEGINYEEGISDWLEILFDF